MTVKGNLGMSIQFRLPDGQIWTGGPFEVNGLAYPGNWMTLANDEDLAAHGITRTSVPDTAVPLSVIKAGLLEAVQAQFDAACATIITPGSSMAIVYRQLVEDAAKVIVDNSLQPDSIMELIGTYGANNVDVATIVMQRDRECIAATAKLNGKRTRAKIAIAAAPDEATARAAANVTW